MPRALKAVEGVSQRARPSEKVGVTLEVVLVLVVELVVAAALGIVPDARYACQAAEAAGEVDAFTASFQTAKLVTTVLSPAGNADGTIHAPL